MTVIIIVQSASCIVSLMSAIIHLTNNYLFIALSMTSSSNYLSCHDLYREFYGPPGAIIQEEKESVVVDV